MYIYLLEHQLQLHLQIFLKENIFFKTNSFKKKSKILPEFFPATKTIGIAIVTPTKIIVNRIRMTKFD